MSKTQVASDDKSEVGLGLYSFSFGGSVNEPSNKWVVYNPTHKDHFFFNDYAQAYTYFRNEIYVYKDVIEENYDLIKKFLLMQLAASADIEEKEVTQEGSFGGPIMFADKSNVVDFMQYLKKQHIVIKGVE